MHEASLSAGAALTTGEARPAGLGPPPHLAVCRHVVGSACVGGSRISQTMVLSYMLLHAPMLGTHMSLRNASVWLQHGSCATACCSLFTRTTLARVARERTPLGRGTRPETHSLLHPCRHCH